MTRIALAAALAALFLASPAAAATRYIEPGGSDFAACTSTAPCHTLARGYEVADAGDIVSVAPGTYGNETLGGSSKSVTFRASGAMPSFDVLVVNAPNLTFDGLQFLRVITTNPGAANLTFENFKIDGEGGDFHTLMGGDGGHHTFRHGEIGNVLNYKGVEYGGSDHVFDDVLFHDVLSNNELVHNECFFSLAPNLTIRNSRFTHCATHDLFIERGTWWQPTPQPLYGGLTLENNVFEHTNSIGVNTWMYYSFAVHGGDLAEIRDWTIRHNTFEITAGMPGANDGVPAYDSRWVGNIGGWGCTPGMVYKDNVGQACSEDDISVSPNGSSSTVTAPFGWADPANHDFHLTEGSPAIDVGDPDDAPATDADGTPRDGAPDAGAFEYVPPEPVRLAGNDALESFLDTTPAGEVEAWPATVAAAGTARKVHIYLDEENTADDIELGVWSDTTEDYQSNGINYTRHIPETLLAHGGIDDPHAGWNTATLTVPHALAADEKVWLSLFSATGAVKYRDRPNGDCMARSTATYSSLPTQWGEQVYEGNLCPASLYVTD